MELIATLCGEAESNSFRMTMPVELGLTKEHFEAIARRSHHPQMVGGPGDAASGITAPPNVEQAHVDQ
jgi:hypothetical protein